MSGTGNITKELSLGDREEHDIPFDEAKRRIISAQTLAFCQRCLGWKDAIPHHDGDHSIRSSKVPSSGRIWFDSLDTVMPAVTWWTAKREITVSMTQFPSGLWSVEFRKQGWFNTVTEGKNLPHLLIMACVEAVNILHDRGYFSDTPSDEQYGQGEA